MEYMLHAYLDSGLSIRLTTNSVPNDEKKFADAFHDFLSSVKDATPTLNTAEVRA